MGLQTLYALMTGEEDVIDRTWQQLLMPYRIALEFCPPQGAALIQRLGARRYDALILCGSLGDLEPAALIQHCQLRSSSEHGLLLLPPPSTVCIALAPLLPTNDTTLLLAAGYHEVLPLPTSEHRIATAIRRHTRQDRLLFLQKEETLRQHCHRLLQDVGAPAHLKGIAYLCECVVCLGAEPDLLYQLTKRLYPQVAGRLNTSASNLERDMRTALNYLLRYGELEKLSPELAHTPSGQARRVSLGGLLGALYHCLYRQLMPTAPLGAPMAAGQPAAEHAPPAPGAPQKAQERPLPAAKYISAAMDALCLPQPDTAEKGQRHAAKPRTCAAPAEGGARRAAAGKKAAKKAAGAADRS